MSSSNHVLNKTDIYQQLLPQIQSLISNNTDLFIASLANTCAVLKENFTWLWVGFYLVDESQHNLVLGPFQGPVACTRIAKGRGVCGQAWQQAQTIIVKDVSKHPDHIACSNRSRSEIVVPLYGKNNQIMGVLDIDSETIHTFDEIDAYFLEQLCTMLTQLLAI